MQTSPQREFSIDRFLNDRFTYQLTDALCTVLAVSDWTNCPESYSAYTILYQTTSGSGYLFRPV